MYRWRLSVTALVLATVASTLGVTQTNKATGPIDVVTQRAADAPCERVDPLPMGPVRLDRSLEWPFVLALLPMDRSEYRVGDSLSLNVELKAEDLVHVPVSTRPCQPNGKGWRDVSDYRALTLTITGRSADSRWRAFDYAVTLHGAASVTGTLRTLRNGDRIVFRLTTSVRPRPAARQAVVESQSLSIVGYLNDGQEDRPAVKPATSVALTVLP